jgi:hypothetical protein
MTNHPHRKHGDLTPEPDPPMAELPPARSANGSSAFGTIDAAQLIGKAVADTLAQALPPALVQALVTVYSQMPVQTVTQQHVCATCLTLRVNWEHAHRADMETAMQTAAEAAGVQPGSPQAAQVDFGPFLPPHLRPGEKNGIPPVSQAITTVQGTEVCPAHVPGVQAGRAPLLVATANIPAGTLGQL